ncbi:MAG: guanylate kinase [Actinomycetota bacterium]
MRAVAFEAWGPSNASSCSSSSPSSPLDEGGLYVIFGPSGVGKGSVIARLLQSNPGGLFFSVSATTRKPRPGEVEGRDYLFLTPERFDELIEDGELLEWADVFGRRYGTPAGPVRKARAAGRDVLLDVDVQGARQIRRVAPDATLIFLAPPDRERFREVLRERLRARGTETPAEVEQRLAEADREITEADRLQDATVVNDDLERATAQVAAILQQRRGRA